MIRFIIAFLAFHIAVIIFLLSDALNSDFSVGLTLGAIIYWITLITIWKKGRKKNV